MLTAPSRTLVLKKLRDCFADAAMASLALNALDSYGLESWHCETDRVQLAILKLSEGDLERLRALVALANTDYRDVLAPAEYPEQDGAGFNLPSEQLDAMRQRDREQYLSWLNSDGP